MADLQTLREAIISNVDRTGGPSVESTHVDRWINQAIREEICHRYNWQQMFAIYRATLTADIAVYQAPNSEFFKDYSRILIAGLDETSEYVPLEELTDFQRTYAFPVSAATGRPRVWARSSGDNYRLLPTPDEDYPVEVRIWEYPATLITDSSTNTFLINYSQIIEDMVTARALRYLGDVEKALPLGQMANENLETKIREDKNRVAPEDQVIVPSRNSGIPASNTMARRMGDLGFGYRQY